MELRQTQEAESQDLMDVHTLSEGGEEQQENRPTPASGPRRYLHLPTGNTGGGQSPGLGHGAACRG